MQDTYKYKYVPPLLDVSDDDDEDETRYQDSEDIQASDDHQEQVLARLPQASLPDIAQQVPPRADERGAPAKKQVGIWEHLGDGYIFYHIYRPSLQKGFVSLSVMLLIIATLGFQTTEIGTKNMLVLYGSWVLQLRQCPSGGVAFNSVGL